MPSLFNFLGSGTKLGFPIGTVGRLIQLFVLREEYLKSVTKGSSPRAAFPYVKRPFKTSLGVARGVLGSKPIYRYENAY